MCGIAGVINADKGESVSRSLLTAMADTLIHRGPDDEGIFMGGHVGFGFRRLSIVDLADGNQPFFSADGAVVLVCNGEIFNYKEIKSSLLAKGYQFKTKCDVEVLVYLYEEYGTNFLNKLNGQFSFAIYDGKRDLLFMARDHVGITPLFYMHRQNTFVFASEIKALLKHPLVERKVNLNGLDQIISFPGLVSPSTMFRGVESVPPGHYVIFRQGKVEVKQYWDLEYISGEEELGCSMTEVEYIEQLEDLLTQSVNYRLNADVPVGCYLSGGLDSSLIAAIADRIRPGSRRKSFSITFDEASIDERKYQRQMVKMLKTAHNEIRFKETDIADKLRSAVMHGETPLKESYNTCSLALSELVNRKGIKVVLTGEGADELFAGYIGYKFDQQRKNNVADFSSCDEIMEREIRNTLWGDENFLYEKNYFSFRETKAALYAQGLKENLHKFDAVREGLIDKSKIAGLSTIHKRSYIDFKLRISDHLVADHGDRVAYANSVEARYPFLDVELINFLARVPSRLKLNGMNEKYILKKCAGSYIPSEIINREKFSFVAPNSKFILENCEWVQDMLSYETIKRQGYFDPETVERLKNMYRSGHLSPNTTFETDILMIIITFGIFLDIFDMPTYC